VDGAPPWFFDPACDDEPGNGLVLPVPAARPDRAAGGRQRSGADARAQRAVGSMPGWRSRSSRRLSSRTGCPRRAVRLELAMDWRVEGTENDRCGLPDSRHGPVRRHRDARQVARRDLLVRVSSSGGGAGVTLLQGPGSAGRAGALDPLSMARAPGTPVLCVA